MIIKWETGAFCTLCFSAMFAVTYLKARWFLLSGWILAMRSWKSVYRPNSTFKRLFIALKTLEGGKSWELTEKGPPKTWSLRFTTRRWDRYRELLISPQGAINGREQWRCKSYLRLFSIKCEPTVDGDWNSETADQRSPADGQHTLSITMTVYSLQMYLIITMLMP